MSGGRTAESALPTHLRSSSRSPAATHEVSPPALMSSTCSSSSINFA